MMARRRTTLLRTLFIVVLIVILIGALAYLIWSYANREGLSSDNNQPVFDKELDKIVNKQPVFHKELENQIAFPSFPVENPVPPSKKFLNQIEIFINKDPLPGKNPYLGNTLDNLKPYFDQNSEIKNYYYAWLKLFEDADTYDKTAHIYWMISEMYQSINKCINKKGIIGAFKYPDPDDKSASNTSLTQIMNSWTKQKIDNYEGFFKDNGQFEPYYLMFDFLVKRRLVGSNYIRHMSHLNSKC